MTGTHAPAWERVLRRCDIGDCWEFQGAKTKDGYGAVGVPGGKVRRTHRVVWEHLVGPVPEGLELDHLCKNAACVNPDHLEPVTHATNIRRAFNHRVERKHNTHCTHGHLRTRRKGVLVCKVCEAAATSRYLAKRKVG